jgi:hypothetical protein
MKSEFVADGAHRLMDARNSKHREAACAKYAAEWEDASLLKRMELRFKIWRECTNQKDEHKPSPGTLW